MLAGRQTPPGGAISSYQQLGADESFFILEGAYTFAIDGMRSALGPGSHVFIPHGTARSFRNTTCAVARMLVLVSPGACPGPFFSGPAAPEPIDVMLQDVA